MVDKEIDIIYRPREEKDENMKYKEDRKRAQKEEERLSAPQSLISQENDEQEATETKVQTPDIIQN